MKARPTYQAQLRDPRWQKRRLEIMERDGFRCLRCGDERTTLNVHHLFYEKDVMAWEYPEWSLITLCEPHHAEEEKFKTQADWNLVAAFRRLGADNRALGRFTLMLADIATNGRTPGAALAQLEWAIDDLWIKQTWRENQ